MPPPPDAAPAATPGHRIRTIAAAVFVAVAAAFVAIALRDQWADVRRALGRLSLAAVAVAMLPLMAGLVAGFQSWRAVLTGLGAEPRAREAARIFFVGQLAKYIPGSVWPVVAQMEAGASLGLARRSVFSATALTIVVSLVCGAVVGLLAVPALVSQGGSTYLFALVAMPVGAAILHPAVLNRLLAAALRLLRRDPLDRRIEAPVLRRAAAWSTAAWLLNGLHVLVLAGNIGSAPPELVPLAVGGFAIAFVCGFLFLVAPAGIGVREAVLVLCLSPVMTPAEASAVAIVSRLAVTATDALAGAASLLRWTRKSRGADAVESR